LALAKLEQSPPSILLGNLVPWLGRFPCLLGSSMTFADRRARRRMVALWRLHLLLLAEWGFGISRSSKPEHDAALERPGGLMPEESEPEESERLITLFIRDEKTGRYTFNAKALKALGVDPAEARERGNLLKELQKNPNQIWPRKEPNHGRRRRKRFSGVPYIRS
jgi:hypothetical protein